MKSQKNQFTKEEILVLDFLNFIKKNQKLITWSVVATSVFFFLVFLIRPTYYMATATVLPVLEKTTSREKTAQIPTALLNLTGQKSEQNALILTTLKARSFISHYAEKHKLLPVLFPDDWDAKKQKWESPDKKPTLRQIVEKFTDLFSVTEGKSKEHFELSLKWKDPELAAKWLNGLIESLNDHFREKTIKTSAKNISYLNTQIQRNTVIEVRQNLSELLQREILKNMVAQNEEFYAVDVIDKATPPEKKHSPKLLLHLGVGLVLGFFLGLLLAALRNIKKVSSLLKTLKKRLKNDKNK